MSLDCWSVDPRQRRQRAASAPLPPCLPASLPVSLPPSLSPSLSPCLPPCLSASCDPGPSQCWTGQGLLRSCCCTPVWDRFSLQMSLYRNAVWFLNGIHNYTRSVITTLSPTFGAYLQVWRNFYQVLLSLFIPPCMWPHNTICLNAGSVICKMYLVSCILAHRLVNRGISKVWSLYGTHHHTNWPLFTVTIVPLTADVSRGWLCITDSPLELKCGDIADCHSCVLEVK